MSNSTAPRVRVSSVQVYTPDEFKDSISQVTKARHSNIADGGLEIAKLLSLTNKTLKVPSPSVLHTLPVLQTRPDAVHGSRPGSVSLSERRSPRRVDLLCGDRRTDARRVYVQRSPNPRCYPREL